MRRVPCGRVTGHGESCAAGHLCESCRRILNLEDVIRGLGHMHDSCYPDGCWCDVAIGNPMLGGKHMRSCLNAQKIMNEIEGGE